MIVRSILFVGIISFPAAAQELTYQHGDTLCFNYDTLEQSCSMISTITKLDEDKIWAREDRVFDVFGTIIKVEDFSVFSFEGEATCRAGYEGLPRLKSEIAGEEKSFSNLYTQLREDALMSKPCVTLRKCGQDFDVFIYNKDKPVPRFSSRLRLFNSGDPVVEELTVRPFLVGKKQQLLASYCEPLT